MIGCTWSRFLSSLAIALMVLATPLAAEPILKQFVEQPDSSYKWELVDSATHEGVTVYSILLTSQTWRDIPWRHHLSIIVPDKSKDTKHALLFITGGGLKDGMPKMGGKRDGEVAQIGRIAALTGSPVAILRQVPNQPLYGDKVEDDLISYTYDQFLKSGDKTWPLLQPMTKSAVKGMTAVQEFCKEKDILVDKFVVSGGSKRGWTTWLTGAVDTRVAAIAPMVIDTLNFAKQMPYQLESWGRYSEQIEDYTRLGLQEKMAGEEGKLLNSIVDPYSYLDTLTMPKMLFMGTNDPYWVVDAVKFYYDDLKGEKSIHYVANAGHNLRGSDDGSEAVKNLAAYFATVASGRKHPQLNWEISVADGNLTLKASANMDAVAGRIWTAEQTDRDFRDAKWNSDSVDSDNPRAATLKIDLPSEGYKAVYLEAFFPSPIGETYSKCTRIFLMDKNGLL